MGGFVEGEGGGCGLRVWESGGRRVSYKEIRSASVTSEMVDDDFAGLEAWMAGF